MAGLQIKFQTHSIVKTGSELSSAMWKQQCLLLAINLPNIKFVSLIIAENLTQNMYMCYQNVDRLTDRHN